ncbi:unnamed protein product [Trichobilharzia szidati]|nr:unnamed protein product [Trichobilharzia szidati]
MAGKVVKQLAGSGTGQSLSDLMTAMKYTLSGSVVVKVICKATTEEMCAPKKKHLAYLVQCTFEPRLSVPDFANQIVNRTQHSNLVVAFKALLTIHHLMQYGNERFSQYIASNNCHFYVPNVHDRNTFQSTHRISVFLRPYAKYLDEKAASYREVAFDFCRLKRGKDDSDMRTMPQEKLLKTLPVIEKQIDALLLFDATTNELSNSLLRVAHLFLYRDLIRLYAVYNEGMINLIGRYFTMSKRDCRLSLEIYKSFVKRMEAMNVFVKVAESAEPGGTPLPLDSENNPFQPVPPSVLEALEQHLAYLEAHKQGDKKTPSNPSPQQSQTNPITSTLSASKTANESESTLAYYNQDNGGGGEFTLTPAERQRIIEEERARLEAFVSTARQHAYSSDHSNQQQHQQQANHYGSSSGSSTTATTTDSDKFLDLMCYEKLSTADDFTSGGRTAAGNPQNSTEQNLLDLNDISTTPSPFSGGLSSTTPQFYIPAAHSSLSTSLVPFIPPTNPTVQPTNPFLLNSNINTSSNQLMLSNFPPSSNQFTNPNPMLTFPAPMMKSTSNTVQPSQSTLSLDDKIAQIAGNLSIRDSYAASQGCRIYRAPDGSLSAVNWSGTMPYVQTSNNSNNSSSNNANNTTMSSSQQLSTPTPTPIHPSPSMNQISSSSFIGGSGSGSGGVGGFSNSQTSLTTGGTAGFSNNFVLNANNPWATAIVPQSLPQQHSLLFTNQNQFTSAATTAPNMQLMMNGGGAIPNGRSTNNNPFL